MTKQEKQQRSEIALASMRRDLRYKHELVVFDRFWRESLAVGSLEETAKFYQDVLGFTVRQLVLESAQYLENDQVFYMAPHIILQKDSCRITFALDGNQQKHASEQEYYRGHLTFEVSNLGAYFDSVVPKLPPDQRENTLLKVCGNEVARYPTFEVRDPNGYIITFVETPLPMD